MRVEDFVKILDAEFYAGVPDSQLKALCDYLTNTFGVDGNRHIIAANEGNCAAVAAGYHLASGKIPVVYMQNSGEGNIINPVTSLLSPQVYAIPIIFVIGWRGEPGISDEPQHIHQGAVTLTLLDDLGIENFVVDAETSVGELEKVRADFQSLLNCGGQVAFVIRKNSLTYENKVTYANGYKLIREEVISLIAQKCGKDILVASTGKIGRELFEVREKLCQGHSQDFLTVGSMGHASSIALGLALEKPEKNFWCIDGDGAFLMHMGAAAVIGAHKPKNFIHIVLNNESHESVGAMPTVAGKINLPRIAEACGYNYTNSVADMDALKKILAELPNLPKPAFIEIKCAVSSRKDLGRPTISPIDNKKNFCKNFHEGR